MSESVGDSVCVTTTGHWALQMKQVCVWMWLGLRVLGCEVVGVSSCERRGALDSLASRADGSGLRCDKSRELWTLGGFHGACGGERVGKVDLVVIMCVMAG